MPTRLVPWLLRVAWVVVLVVAVPALDGAFQERSRTALDVARGAGGAVWLAGVAAMAIPSVVGLTATRAIVPLSVPAAIATGIGGAALPEAIGFVVAGLAATFIACSAELGRAFVQASAYGDEDRHVLRPPLVYLVACAVTWIVWAGALLAGTLLLADRRWLLGGVCSALAVAGAVWAWPRWHKLSRRWLVLVPTGLVLHDHLVLGETLMIRRDELTGVRLAPAATEALDLTGPAPGHAVEVSTGAATTAILAATPKTPRGRAIHFTGCLVSPTRPGRFLAASRARRLPVG